MKIGLVGESPGDIVSIFNLLSPQMRQGVVFVEMVKRINGDQLGDQKVKHLLRKEYEDHNPDLVIFMRDLDGLPNETEKIRLKREYFSEFNSVVDKRGIFLLNIWEIEALIYADIEIFNQMFDCSVPSPENPMSIPEPKEELEEASRKGKKPYNNSDNPAIFAKLNYQVLKNNCAYFREFAQQLETQAGIS